MPRSQCRLTRLSTGRPARARVRGLSAMTSRLGLRPRAARQI